MARGSGVAPPTQKVGGAIVLGSGGKALMSLLMLLVAMLVVGFPPVVSQIFIVILEERDRTVLFWVCPGPSLPA